MTTLLAHLPVRGMTPRDVLTLSGGSRPLRDLHHRLISCEPIQDESGHPPFLDIHEVKEGDDVLAIREACLGTLLNESWSRLITPAALEHEAIEEADVLVIRLATMLEAPFEHFFIAAAVKRARREIRKAHAEQCADTIIKRAAAWNEVEMVSLRQLSLTGMIANLVQNAAKDGDAADSVTRRAKRECHGVW